MSELTECHGSSPNTIRPCLLLPERTRPAFWPGPPIGNSAEKKLVESTNALALGALVVHVYLLAPDILLNHLCVLNHVLADPDLLLGNRALLHHNLFLGYGHPHLVLTYLGLCCSALREGHAIDGDLLAAGGDLYLLAVGADALADV